MSFIGTPGDQSAKAAADYIKRVKVYVGGVLLDCGPIINSNINVS